MSRYVTTTVQTFEMLPCGHVTKFEVAETSDGLFLACTECAAVVRIPRRCKCGRRVVQRTTLELPPPPLWFPRLAAASPNVLRQIEQDLRATGQNVAITAGRTTAAAGR